MTTIRPAVSSFLASLDASLFIGGAWVAPLTDDRVIVLDPATERPVAEIADATRHDVDAGVVAARTALDGAWGRCSARQRSRLMLRLAEAIDAHADDFAQLEALDNGKGVTFARAVDVEKAIEWFEYFAGWPTKLEGSTLPAPADRRLVYTLREPVGVVGQIVPWNYPLMLAAWKLAPALAAGCTVVLKPAEETPLSALLLGRLIEEVGFPPGVVNIVTGTGERTGAALAAHPGIDKLSFTGSTMVGRSIAHASADHLRAVTLELGGNSANILLDDVDVSAVVAQLADAAFANHGQNCCAGARLFVPRCKADETVAALADIAGGLRIGPGLDPATDLGPLISRVHLDRVRELIENGRAAGAEVAVGGDSPDGRDAGYFLEPTVIVGAGDASPVVREEVFGPVVTVLPYDTLDEVVTRANGTDYGLAAGIWTRDLRAAHDLAARLKVGTVWINTYNETSPAVPFGGFKHSGIGREHGRAVLDHYTEHKSVWVGLDPLDGPVRA
jgi:acyl-CoA reductase-like NAD-dependent aldehyde dehydrogenase